MKEVEEAVFFKMRLMDAIANISTSTTPAVPKMSLPQEKYTINASTLPASPSTSSDTSNPPTSTSISSDASNLAATTSTSSNTSIPPASTSPSVNASIPLDSSASYSHPNSTGSAPRPSKSRLPKNTLPKSKGDVTHTNIDLTKIDKFNYLVSLLEGTASRAIAGLPITEENYDAAVDIIKKRFGKPQQLISAHMDELLKISTCPTDKPYQLRYLYDKLNVNIRGLEALGVKASQYESLLIPIIMAKLPPEIRVHVAQNTTEDVWDIESILNVIQNEIEAREIGEKI